MSVGVNVNVVSIPAPSSFTPATGSSYFVVGQTTRGNSGTPVHCTSLAQYVRRFGSSATDPGFLLNDVTTFFNEGGTDVWVQRAVGSNAAAGQLTLNDTSGSGGQPTLLLTAGTPNTDPVTGIANGNVADYGSWSQNLSVQVTQSQTIATAWNLVVFYGGVQVEQWGPFDGAANPLDPGAINAACATINYNSEYLLASNEQSSSTGATANPAVVGQTALSAGTSDSGDVTPSTLTGLLANFQASLGPGAVSIPGYDASTVGTALMAHAGANGRIAILHTVGGVSSSSALSAAAPFRSNANAKSSGIFWPWVQIPGVQGAIPPSGFVAGRRSATIALSGPWQAPAGNWGLARYVTGLDPNSGTVTDTIGNLLNSESVDVIRPKVGIRLYGWRSLSTDTANYALLNQIDTVNWLGWNIDQALEQYVDALIDAGGSFATDVSTTVLGVLAPLISGNVLYPAPDGSDPGYLIDVGSDVNTTATLNANTFVVSTYVRLAPTAELIQANVTKVGIGVNF